MKALEKRINKREARLFRAYRELERLDGEHRGPVIMPYEVAEQFKVGILESIGELEGLRHEKL